MWKIGNQIVVTRIRRVIRRAEAYTWCVSPQFVEHDLEGIDCADEVIAIRKRLAIVARSLGDTDRQVCLYKLENPDASMGAIACAVDVSKTTISRSFERLRDMYVAMCERAQQEQELYSGIYYLRKSYDSNAANRVVSNVWTSMKPWAHLLIVKTLQDHCMSNEGPHTVSLDAECWTFHEESSHLLSAAKIVSGTRSKAAIAVAYSLAIKHWFREELISNRCKKGQVRFQGDNVAKRILSILVPGHDPLTPPPYEIMFNMFNRYAWYF